MNCTLSVAMLLTLAASAAAQVLPACGGPGEHSTHAAQGQEFWTMDSLAGEYDLALKGTRREEKNRTTQPDSAGWIGWALREQRHNIQGTLPVFVQQHTSGLRPCAGRHSVLFHHGPNATGGPFCPTGPALALRQPPALPRREQAPVRPAGYSPWVSKRSRIG
jgi:hypothetical protein